VESYRVFPAGQLALVPGSDSALQAVLAVLQSAFLLGVQLAAPVVAAGLLANLVFGIFNRLIPQLQIFFITIPLSIGLGMAILAASMGAIVVAFGTALNENLTLFMVLDNLN
jgi:flagellar biosynthesis protein FliR